MIWREIEEVNLTRLCITQSQLSIDLTENPGRENTGFSLREADLQAGVVNGGCGR